MKKHHLLLLFMTAITAFACNDGKKSNLPDGLYAEFKTNKGNFTAELFYEATPLTVASFVSLAEGKNPNVDKKYEGKKFYNGLTFHRIIDGFMIQGGDPEGTGAGAPGYAFPDEFVDSLKHDSKGVLSMANAGPGTNGSQFFITLAPTPNLDKRHSIFGQIVEGQAVVDSIGKVETGQRDKPVEDIIMQEVTIVRVGEDAKNFNAPKVFKDEMTATEEKAQKKKEAIEKEIENISDGYKKTDSGLRYKITETNPDGTSPARGQMVKVHYTGTLTDGTKFDSSYDRDKPISFPLGTGRVIPGWDEGIQLLKTGEKARFIIPPHLGYGKNGTGPIPPNSILIFDVELVEVGQ